MHDILLVREVERVCYFSRDLNGVVDGKLFLAIEPIAERFPLDVRHDVEQEAVGFARIEQREDVGMV
jgi:hypothetical protein